MIDFGCQGRVGRGCVHITPLTLARAPAGRGLGGNSVGASSQSGNSSLGLAAHEPLYSLYAVARRPRIGRRCQVWGRTRPESGPRSPLARVAPALRLLCAPRPGRIRWPWTRPSCKRASRLSCATGGGGSRSSSAQGCTGDRPAVRSAPPGPRRKRANLNRSGDGAVFGCGGAAAALAGETASKGPADARNST